MISILCTSHLNTSQVMHICDPVLGIQFYGTIVNDPSDGCTLNSNHRSHGNQNDRQISMNLQNHEYYNIDYVNIESQYQEPQSMRQPHNCIPKVINNTVHTSMDTSDCTTRLCTVQFMNKYWLGTDINTHLVFLSDGNAVNKFCYWNHNL